MAVHPARASLASRLTSVCRGLLLLVCGSGLGPASLQAQLLPSSADPSFPQVERWHGNVRSRPAPPGRATTSLTDVEAPTLRPTPRPNPVGKSLLLPGDGERILPPLKPVESALLVPPPTARPDSDRRVTTPAPSALTAPVPPVAETTPLQAGRTSTYASLGDGCTWETLKNLVWLVKESTGSLRTCVEWFREQNPRSSASVAFDPASGAVPSGAPYPGSLHPGTVETAMPLHRVASAAGAESPTQTGVRQETDREVPWRQVMLMQLPGTIAALLGGPLVAVALILVLRRSGIMFRVEMVNPPTYVVEGGSRLPAQTLPAAPSPVDSALTAAGFEEPLAPPPEEEPSTAEAFDLGPTYEEERLRQQEAAIQQEMAVLQQIFEDNLLLQQEIQQISAAPAETAAAAEGQGG